MYVSTNWLKAILNLTHVNLITIKDRLTSSGFEVEETKILKILNQNDIILDLKTITNRPDILSIIGLTNEIRSLIYINFKKVNLKKANFNFFKKCNQNQIKFSNNFSSTICFISSSIENIKVEKIQPWIKKRLISSNILPENNLNDIAKYCLLEWGQPIFLYDLDKIKKLTNSQNPKIEIRFAKIGEIFVDSNSLYYKLTEQTLLILANNIPISIAGSVVSKDCNIDCFTKSIMIELSIFDPKVFRNSERSVGVRTIMSVFYERGISPFLVKPSYNRFLNLLFLFNINFSFTNNNNLVYFKELFYTKKLIPLSFKNIESLLGNSSIKKEENISKRKVFECLNKMRFDFVLIEDYCKVRIPLTRYSDIEEEIDLIEEISRFVGFDNFKSILMKVKQIGKLSKYENLKRKFRQSFLNLGFIEVFNYSLITQENLNNPIIINPLIVEYSSLRTNLISQLIKSLEKNITQGNKVLPIFEIGRVFKKYNSTFLESESICGVFGDTTYKIEWSEKNLILNWFQAKTILENILISLQINYILEKKTITSEFYNPKNCLAIMQNNEEIGIFGSINPKFSSSKGLSHNCFLFEIELTKILTKRNAVLYKTYSVYPPLTVDLSLMVPKQISFTQINLIIKNLATNLIDQIEVFDLYEKGHVNKDCYSLGIKIVFKSKAKTLLKTDIDLILLKIQNELKQNLNIEVRI